MTRKNWSVKLAAFLAAAALMLSASPDNIEFLNTSAQAEEETALSIAEEAVPQVIEAENETAPQAAEEAAPQAAEAVEETVPQAAEEAAPQVTEAEEETAPQAAEEAAPQATLQQNRKITGKTRSLKPLPVMTMMRPMTILNGSTTMNGPTIRRRMRTWQSSRMMTPEAFRRKSWSRSTIRNFMSRKHLSVRQRSG